MVNWETTPWVSRVGELVLQECWWEGEGGGEKGVGMDAGSVEGYGGEVKGERLTGEGVPLMLAA